MVSKTTRDLALAQMVHYQKSPGKDGRLARFQSE